ncbi:MAG: hypothetical protein HYZ16_08185 [Bacteroidetes bacterium]|nr:hypothetical protein [Bacteroidota bacterium]
MKAKIYTCLFLTAALCCVSCAPQVCPANGREMQYRQLAKINQGRKPQKGLFPKSMRMENRKEKKNQNSIESVEQP